MYNGFQLELTHFSQSANKSEVKVRLLSADSLKLNVQNREWLEALSIQGVVQYFCCIEVVIGYVFSAYVPCILGKLECYPYLVK